MFHPRPDVNKKAIVEVWRLLGCVWVDADEYSGLDGFLIAPNGIHAVEIKNPDRNWKLTQAEAKRKDQIERLGQKYNFILRTNEAITLAGFMLDDYVQLAQVKV
jgi:hypothetical protein